MRNAQPLPAGPFDIIYADPPWHYYGDPDKDQAAGKHYRLMRSHQISALPVRAIAADRAVLFLWATCPKLDVALDVMAVWQFHFRGVAWVWVKTRRDGGIIHGQGIRPSVVKPTTELVLVGSTVSRGRPLPILTESMGQVVLAPRGEHSEKPEQVRRNIERLYGERRRVELFARTTAPGWVTWGDEIGAA